MMDKQKAAVIGHPLGHTMSPFIHQRLFGLAGIPVEYRVLDLPDLAGGLKVLRGLDAFNITIPYKNQIIPFLDEIEEKAARFGSVNTVRVREGKLWGATTDGAGCRKALAERSLDFSGRLLLLGNGGAARAIAFEALEQAVCVDLTVVCRAPSLEKAGALRGELLAYGKALGKERITVEVLEYTQLERAETRYDLLFNTTSVGMFPHKEASPVTLDTVKRCAAVFDAVYNPSLTALLGQARSLGIPAVGGMEMLVYQAVAAHELWYGTRFPQEDLVVLCQEAKAEMERIFGEGKL